MFLLFLDTMKKAPTQAVEPLAPGQDSVYTGCYPDILLSGRADYEIFTGDTIVKKRLAANGYAIKREFSPEPATVLCFLEGLSGEEVELVAHK
jgi:hypothetical protein